MLTRRTLERLAAEFGGTRVLSIYLDRLPMEGTGRGIGVLYLAPLLAEAEHAVEPTQDDRDAFDRCVQRLQGLLALDQVPFQGARAWVAFIPAAGRPFAQALPVEVPLRASWSTGPRLAPCVRALKQHVPEVLAVAGAHEVRVFRYENGVLDDLGCVHPQDPAGLVLRAVERIVALAGDDGWIVTAGTLELSHALLEAVPEEARTRAWRVRGVDPHADHRVLAALAEREAMAGSRRRDLEQVLDLLDREAAGGLGISGFAGTIEAFRAGAVEQLYFTGAFVRRQPERAEELVRMALEAGAGMEYVSAAAAARLDLAGGVGARLRSLVCVESALHGPGLAALVR